MNCLWCFEPDRLPDRNEGIISEYWSFAVVVLLLTLTPGADAIVVVRTAIGSGRAAGVFVAVGGGISLFAHATLSAVGLSAVLMHSPSALRIVQFAGAGYLVFLGIGALLRLRGTRPAIGTDGETKGDEQRSLLRAFADGFLTNLLNPKVSAFYLAILPQYLESGNSRVATTMVLTLIHFVLAVVWKSSIACAVDRTKRIIVKPRIWRAMECVSGVALIAFAMKIILSGIQP